MAEYRPGPRSSGLAATEQPLSQVHDLAILDLDGVVYIGAAAVPGAVAALATARAAGMARCFVTNNASRPPEAVAEHLNRLGVAVGAAEVLTSAQVAASLLAERLPGGGKVLVVGGEGLRLALRHAGLVPVSSLDDGAVAVVQGFSPSVDWHQLAEGTRAVLAGLPWVASNLDPTFPTEHGPAPGNGSLVQAVATATGHRPELVAGKPSPEPFLTAARDRAATDPLVIGDRLDTDIEGACAAGMASLAVMTGVSGATDLLRAPGHQRPCYLGADLGQLLLAHPGVTLSQSPEGPRARCRDTVVGLDRGGSGSALVVHAAAGDPVDLLRAGCALAWAEPAEVELDLRALVAAIAAATGGARWAR